MGKSDERSQGVAVSTVEPTKDASALIAAIDAKEVAETPDETVTGSLTLSLSKETMDAMSRELRDALHQIETGFGELVSPSDLFKLDQQFYVIDGFTIPDYVDQATGEEKVKHVFRLEFPDGVVRNTMQSDARPRRVLAKAFMLANGMGGRLRIGPYKYEQKKIPRFIQPAFIFVQQPGFKQEAF